MKNEPKPRRLIDKLLRPLVRRRNARVRRTQRLQLEQLETRNLLAGEVAVSLDATTTGGQPLNEIEVGSDFLLNVRVQDTRAITGGVTSGFIDVQYESNLASALDLTHGGEYNIITAGSIATPGLIDDAGGNATNFPAPTDTDATHLLFSVRMQADAVGTLNFTPDAADNIGNVFLIFGSLDSLPFGEVAIPSVFSIDIVDNGQTGNDIAFSISGDTSVNEGVSANYTLSFSGNLSGSETASVDISLSDISTIAGDHGDLVTAVAAAASSANNVSFDGSSTITFNAGGDTSLNFTITTDDDTIDESNEQFSLDLSTPIASGANTSSIAAGTTTTTIVDDDDPPPPVGTLVEYSVVLTTVPCSDVGDCASNELPRQTPGNSSTPYVVTPGQTVYAHVFVDDLRTIGSSGGVFAAFADATSSNPGVLGFDVGSVEVESSNFPNAQSGSVASSSVVEEAGGGASITPLGVDPARLLFRVQATVPIDAADAATTTIALNAAEPMQGDHDTLLRSFNGPAPASYGSEDVIVDAPVQSAGSPYQNPTDPLDVDNNGTVNLADLQRILDEIEVNGVRALPDPPVAPLLPNPTPGVPGSARFLDTNGDGDLTFSDAQMVADFLNSTSTLNVARPESGNDKQPLTLAETAPIVEAAIDRYVDAGITAEQEALLRSVEVTIADLPDNTLGIATGNHITLDLDGGGLCWLIDATPGADEEFTLVDGKLVVNDQAMADRADLLTVVAHELGHVLGLDHLTAEEDEDDLMYHILAVGQRKLPTPETLDQLFGDGSL